jgi:hypothetical protein
LTRRLIHNLRWLVTLLTFALPLVACQGERVEPPLSYAVVEQARRTMDAAAFERYAAGLVGREVNGWRGTVAGTLDEPALLVDTDGDGTEDVIAAVRKTAPVGSQVRLSGRVREVRAVAGHVLVWVEGARVTVD